MNRRIVIGPFVLVAAIGIAQTSFFYFRDNFSTHYPLKVLSAESYRSGEIPFWNHAAGGGQALAGNPNLLTFYPDNVLYLLFPARTAFNLHFLLHLAIAFLAMRRLCRALKLEERTANVGALLYILSGIVVSTTAFYNLVVAAALVPLFFALLHELLEDPKLSSSLPIGVTAGLLGLAGEPVVIAATAVATLIIVAGRSVTRCVGPLVAAVFVALAVAAPQLIAYSEIASLTERSFQKFSTQSVLAASLGPWRLAEMLFGPFLGFVTDASPSGFSSVAPPDHRPVLFLSLFVGVSLLPALLQKVTSPLSRYRWIALGFLFIALGRHNPFIVALVDAIPALHLARYPEKFALHANIALVVLTAAWIDRGELTRRDRVALVLTPLAGITLALVAAATLPSIAVRRLIAGVVISIVLAIVARRKDSLLGFRLTIGLLVASSFLFMLQALPLDRPSHYAPDAATVQLVEGKRIWRYQCDEAALLAATGAPNLYPLRASGVEPLFGVAFNVRYALDRSTEGMYSYLSRVVAERADSTTLPVALRYARIAGCDFVVSRNRLIDPALELRSAARTGTLPLFVYAISGTAPYVTSAKRIVPTRSINDAVRAIEGADFLAGDVTAPGSIKAAEAASIRNVRASQGTISFDVEAAGPAVVVVNESYAPGWRVLASTTALSTFPANIDRLGIIVPAGRHHVVATFGKRRGSIYFALSLSLALVFAALGRATLARVRSRKETAAPAR